MIKINVRTTFPAVAKALDKLPEEIANKAMARALNATVDQGKVQMAKQIGSEYRMSASDIKARLDVQRARSSGSTLKLTAALMAANKRNRAGGRGANLIAFVESSVSLAQARKRRKDGTLSQIRFQIKRTGGKKMIPGAFIAHNSKTGGTAVFIREGSGRYPIKPLTTIDVAQMFNARKVNEVVRKVMLDRFDANFSRELRSVLQGWAR